MRKVCLGGLTQLGGLLPAWWLKDSITPVDYGCSATKPSALQQLLISKESYDPATIVFYWSDGHWQLHNANQW